MAALAKELGVKAGVEKDEDGEVKSSSSITIQSRIGDDDEEIEDGKQAVIATSRRVSSSLGGEGESGRDGEGQGDGIEPKNDADHHALTLSRARCIALVATVTGAAFLNVSESEMDEACIDNRLYTPSTPQLTKCINH